VVGLRDDEGVTAGQRVGVKERQHVVVLVDDAGRDVATYYLAERTVVVHIRS